MMSAFAASSCMAARARGRRRAARVRQGAMHRAGCRRRALEESQGSGWGLSGA
jgi:hypothetical protein